MSAFREAVEFLSSEGHIYSTIDDDHYKATDSMWTVIMWIFVIYQVVVIAMDSLFHAIWTIWAGFINLL